METRIREIRAEKGWTVRRLAGESGVDKNTISEAERGLRKPNPITMHKLAEALGVDFEDLVEEARSSEAERTRERRQFFELVGVLSDDQLRTSADNLRWQDIPACWGSERAKREEVALRKFIINLTLQVRAGSASETTK